MGVIQSILERIGEFFQKLSNQFFEHGFLPFLITLVAIAAALIIVLAVLDKNLKKRVEKRPAAKTQTMFVGKVVRALVIAFAAYGVLIQFKPFNSLAGTILASAGLGVLVVGLAAQEAMGNLVAGFFLSMTKPFSIGDRVTVVDKGITGVVEDITMRHTVLVTAQNTRMIIPNAVMNGAVIDNTQFGDTKSSFVLDFTIGYDSDMEKAMAIIAEEVAGHPSFLDPRSDKQKAAGEPAIVVRVAELGESGVVLRCVPSAPDFGAGAVMGCDLRLSVKKRFDAEGIEIPCPCRKVIVAHEDK